MPSVKICLKCCVPDCPSIYKIHNVGYHRLPSNLKMFHVWRKKIGRRDLYDKSIDFFKKYIRVCGRHFPENMYVDFEKKFLKEDAVPVLYVPHNKSKEISAKDLPEELSYEIPLEFCEEVRTDHLEIEDVQCPLPENEISEELSLDQLSRICRICLTKSENDKFFTPDSPVDSGLETKTIESMIKTALPDLDLALYPNSILCDNCVTLLCHSVKLKEFWRRSKQRLESLTEQKRKHIHNKIAGDINKNYHYIEHDYTSFVCGGVFFVDNTKQKESKDSQEVNNEAFPDLYVEDIRSEESNTRKPVELELARSVPYLCHLCGCQIMALTDFEKHQLSHKKQQIKKYVCAITNHERRDEDDFTCNKCGRKYKTKLSLKDHFLRNHSKRVFQCKICGKLFSLRRSYITHVKYVHGKSTNCQCDFCDKVLYVPNSWRTRLDNGLLRKKHKCLLCGKKFIYQSNLRNHVNVKHGN